MSFNKAAAFNDFLRKRNAAPSGVGVGLPNVGALATVPAPVAFSPQIIAAPQPVGAFVPQRPQPSPVMAALAQSVGMQQPQDFGGMLPQPQQQPSAIRGLFGQQQPDPMQRSAKQQYKPGTVSDQDMNYLLDLEVQAPGKNFFKSIEGARIGSSANRERDDANVNQNFPGQMSQAQARIDEIDAELNTLYDTQDPVQIAPEDISSVYNAQTNQTIWFHRTGGQQIATAEGNLQGFPPPVTPSAEQNAGTQVAALEHERNTLQAQIDQQNNRLQIAQGNTISGRPGDFVDGIGGTAMNVLDAGREATVTEYGDAIIEWIQTGDTNATVDIFNALGSMGQWPTEGDGNPNNMTDPGTLGNNDGGLSGDDLLGQDAQLGLNMPLTEESARNSPQAGAWMFQWIQEDESRAVEAVEVYNRGYDADGDGMIDFTGGRAVWEWYIGQQPWTTSIYSQILFDPLNLTMVAGGASAGLKASAAAARAAGNTRQAVWLGRVGTALGYLSNIDDPIWWVQDGVIGGIARGGRRLGVIRNAAGEVITDVERQAANAALLAENTAPMMDLAATPVDQVPVHNATNVNGQQVQQVGNTGSTFVGQSADGGFAVFTRGQNGQLTQGDSFATQDEAIRAAREEELVKVGLLYANPATAGQAAAYDTAVPVVYDNQQGIAYVGYGQEIRVVYNQQSGQYQVQLHVGNGRYNPVPGSYNDPTSALAAAQQNYLQTGFSGTTGGGVPVTNPRPSTPMSGEGAFSQPAVPGAATYNPSILPPSAQGGGPLGGTAQQGQPSLFNPTGAANMPGAAPNPNGAGGAPGGAVNPMAPNQGGQLNPGGVVTPGAAPATGGANNSNLVAPPMGTTNAPVGGTAPAGQTGAAPATGAATTPVTPRNPGGLNSDPMDLADPRVGLTPADVDTANPVVRGGLTYHFQGTSVIDNAERASWSVTAEDGSIYYIDTDPATDGGLSIQYAGNASGPADQPEMLPIPDGATMEDTARIIAAHQAGQTIGGVPSGAVPSDPATGAATDVAPGLGAVPADGGIGGGAFADQPVPGAGAADDGIGGSPITDQPPPGDGMGAPPSGAVPPESAMDALDDAQTALTGDSEFAKGFDPNDAAPGGAGDEFERNVSLASAGDDVPTPAGAALSTAPAGVADNAVPAGAAPEPGIGTVRGGMYNNQLTDAATGAGVRDSAPHSVWLDNAVRTVIDQIGGDNAEISGRITAWFAENPRVQQAEEVFNVAARQGDEIDQALASMELQATMIEEWARGGALAEYGPIRAAVSPGAEGADIKNAVHGSREWARSGRAVERLATAASRGQRAGGFDFQNLANTGFLPGRESDIINALREGKFPQWAASTDGRKFIVPDGSGRLFADQFAQMSPGAREQLIRNLSDRGFRSKAYQNQDRLNEVIDRIQSAQSGNPRGADTIRQPDAPAAATSQSRPGADTKESKADAEVMSPEQQHIIPGERFTGWDAYRREDGVIDVADFTESYTPFGQWLGEDEVMTGSLKAYREELERGRSDLSKLAVTIDWVGFVKNADKTARYDIERIRVASKAYLWSIVDENGHFHGAFRSKTDLLKAVSEVETGTDGVNFLRLFHGDTGRLAVLPRGKGNKKLGKSLRELQKQDVWNGQIQILNDQDGLYHIVVNSSMTSNGVPERVAVWNTYDTLGDAKTDVLDAMKKGDWPEGWKAIGPDGNVITPGGAGGSALATIPGWPQLGRKLNGLFGGPRGSWKSSVPAPKNDGTFAGRMFDDGAIDEEVYGVLTSTYKKADGLEVVVQDEMLERMVRYGSLDKAYNEVLDEWKAANMPSAFKDVPGSKPTKAGRITGNVFRDVNSNARANALYGMHRFFAGVAGDTIGNAYTSILSGYGITALNREGLTLDNWRNLYSAIANGRWDSIEDSVPVFQKAGRNGVTLKASDLGDVSKWDLPTSGDMPGSQLLQKVGVPRTAANVMIAPFQFKGSRNARNFGDAIDRLGLANVEYDRQLIRARGEMMQVVEDEAIRLGQNADRWVMEFAALGDEVNDDLLRSVFDNNRIINRAWKQQTLAIRDNVLKATKKYKFVGGRTNLDEFASNFLFFHYWNSRALALHAEIAAKNPILINLYLSAYEDGKQRAEELNLAPWLVGWVKFMGSPDGWMGFFHPFGMLIPFFMFAEMGGDDFGEKGLLDQILSLGAFSPWVLGALTVAGQMSRMPDLTFSSGTLNFARTVINYVRSEGLGPIDQHLSPVGDPLDDLQDKALNWLSKNIGEDLLGGTEVEQTDVRGSDLRLLNLMMDLKMGELYGPNWRDNPTLVAYANAGKAAFESGQGHNPVSEQVYQDWASDRFKQLGPKMLVPGWFQSSYGPQNDNWAQVNSLYEKLDRGESLTDEEQEILDANTQNTLTPDARNLSQQMDNYYDIGTKFQRDLNHVRTMLLYDQAPEGTWVVINDNENYSAEEWNAMTTDDRRDAVWRWVAAQGGTDQLNAYYQARDAYLEQHPELRDFVAWQQAFRGDPEIIHEELMRRSPEYASYINSQRNPNDQNRWMTIEAYYASRGEQYGMGDNPVASDSPNPMHDITGYLYQTQEQEDANTPPPDDDRETYGSGEWATMQQWQQNAPAEFAQHQIDEYEGKVQAAQPIVDDVLEEGGWGWMAGMTYDEIAATAAQKGTSKAYDEALQAIKNELYRLDVPVPGKGGEMRDYERWRDARLATDPNADVSLEVYEAEKLEGQERYGVGRYDPETRAIADQEAANAERASYWNANPNSGFYGGAPDTSSPRTPDGGYSRYLPAPRP